MICRHFCEQAREILECMRTARRHLVARSIVPPTISLD
jgi:hypothetical protein